MWNAVLCTANSHLSIRSTIYWQRQLAMGIYQQLHKTLNWEVHTSAATLTCYFRVSDNLVDIEPHRCGHIHRHLACSTFNRDCCCDAIASPAKPQMSDGTERTVLPKNSVFPKLLQKTPTSLGASPCMSAVLEQLEVNKARIKKKKREFHFYGKGLLSGGGYRT